MWRLIKVLVGVAIYGTALEPRFVVRSDQTAVIPNLPALWEGKQLAVFGDLQVGMWWANTDAVRRIVRRVVDLRPAAVLIPGDFVYNADSSVDDLMREVVGLLRPILDAGIPTYAVLGNHDYSLMHERSGQENRVARRVGDALTQAGVAMMDNKVVALPSPAGDSVDAEPLYLAGIGEKWAKNDIVGATLAMIPAAAPRIVLMHDPDSFALIPAEQAPLAIAGHTHGLQIGIPYLSDYYWRHYVSDTGSGVAGWIDGVGAPGNRLYINRGVGFSGVPARVHAVPELTVFTLTRAK